MLELHFRPLMVYRTLSVILILILVYLMILLWGEGDARNSIIISLFLLTAIKYFQGVLVTRIDVTKNSIVLGRTLGSIRIMVRDIDQLSIRYVDSSKLDEFPESYKYLEISTKSGKHYVYPMTSGRISLRETELKSITGLDYRKLPKLNPRISNRYLMFNLWV